MKIKYSIWPVVLTLGMLASAGCSSESGDSTPGDSEVTLTLTADVPVTRTYIEGDGSQATPFVTNWDEAAAEEIGVFIADTATPTSNAKFTGAVNSSTKVATFTGTVNKPTTSTALPLYAYYPYSAGVSGTSGEWFVTIPQTQQATVTGFDPTGNIMVAEPVDVDPNTFTSSAALRFKHKNAFLRINAGTIEASTGVAGTEKVKSVTINAKTGRITGKFKIDLTDPHGLMTETSVVGEGFSSVVLEIPEAYRMPLSSFSNGWVCIAPVVLEPASRGGEGWDITIETDAHYIKKTLLPATEPKQFKEGNAYVMAMDIDGDATVTSSGGPTTLRTAEEEVWSQNGLEGEYLLVGKKNSDWYVANSMKASSVGASVVNVADGRISESFAGEFDQLIVTIDRKEGAGDNMYTMKFQDKYLSAAGDLASGIKFFDAENTTHNGTTFEITYSNDIWQIKSQYTSSTVPYMRFNTTYSDFRCMMSTTTPYIYLYKVSGGSVTPPQPEKRSFSPAAWAQNAMDGNYLVLGQKNEVWYAGNGIKTNSLGAVAVNIADGKVTENFKGEFDDYIVTIVRKEDEGDDMYTMKFQDKYMSAAGELSAGMKFYDAELGNKGTTFSITYPDGKWLLKSQYTGSSVATMRFNTTYSDFRCMMNLTQATDVYLYKQDE